MIDDKSLQNEVEPSSSIHMSDPDAQRDEEWKGERHKIRLALLRKLPYVIIIFGTVFLILLFFVIMPFSEMNLDAGNWQEWLRDYSQAFIAALGSFGVTVLAVLVSELLKYGYQLIKQSKTAK